VKNLFVGNLGPEVTHEELRQHSTQTRTPSSLGEREPRVHGLRDRGRMSLTLRRNPGPSRPIVDNHFLCP
jgi:hypothetical protein